MKSAPFRVVALDATHDRASFRCGSAPLDRYLTQQASQDIKRRVASCFVALNGSSGIESDQAIVGFYTLAAASVPFTDLSQELARKLPRYPSVPAIRLGRLAVHELFKGRGIGGALLADAVARACRSEIAAYALIVEAKDDSAVAFYRHHGLVPLPRMPRTLVAPLSKLRLLAGTG